MRKAKKKAFGSRKLPGDAVLAPSANGKPKKDGLWEILTKPRNMVSEISSRELTFILKNLATLTENGVSLPKALETLAAEKALEKHSGLLNSLRRDLENGETLSRALGKHSSTFDNVMINQIKVGERTGRIPDTLRNIAEHREKAGKLRSTVFRKLSYPVLLITVGSGVITFLMIFVVPVFQDTYADAGVPLPLVTQIMIALGNGARRYAWLLFVLPVAAVLLVRQLRRNADVAYRMDHAFLHLPLFGMWLRDMAVLQLMEVLGNLMEAGFTLAEGLDEAARAMQNRAIKSCVEDLHEAVNRGERFSREIERLGDMFPPIVSQLVIMGEQTGKLANTTRLIRTHLEEEIERKTSILVATLEPVLTISLATAIGLILLAIYLPMFDMISTMG